MRSIRRFGGVAMEKVYANIILKGKKTIDEVPDRIRDTVRQILIDRGYPELTESEGVTK